MGNETVATGGGAAGTVGQARERWSEFFFWLATFFGGLHFVSIAGQVAVMFMATALKHPVAVKLQASSLMGNIYLGFLAVYVGRKEYVRWFSGADEDAVPRYVWKKLSRGELIIAAWAVLTGLTVLLWQMGLIGEVPGILVTTLAEVVGVWCGGEALKYFKGKYAGAKREAEENAANFGDRAVDLCRERGQIDNEDCQREFGLSKDQAYRLLKKLETSKRLRYTGATKGRKYALPESVPRN